ncbi:MAG: UDP-glucuronate decarboxylase [uncultured Acidimicrobiales bacterium]|uniref:UDP-glucuronate decarboxylase n=1 Tax=uncultured Acidimicrobiales bacterium TaxID=310071 RepID=A0A6J4JAA3_9ACTN|nr:MAG: UDP-glucuronate decarboxylase [uncultured Acidimicrobiales bacterium]
MRVVVTGAAGFLGSHLCEALLGRGDEVVGYDNLVTGQRENVDLLCAVDGFTFVEQDVTEHLEVRGPVDGVLHLASPASPEDFAEIPIKIMKVGAMGTANCLGLARAKGSRFVLASTSEVYGDPLVHPQPETYWGNVNPIGERGCYDEAKRFAEALSLAYARQHDVDVGIVRTFNTSGPRFRPADGRVLSTFVTQALRGEPITVQGDGSQTRSICYVDDQVRGYVAMLDHPGVTGPVNIGTEDEITILRLAELVREMVDSTSPIEHVAARPDDPSQRCPDLARARQLLGWNPQVPLEDGLRRTIAWFRERA